MRQDIVATALLTGSAFASLGAAAGALARRLLRRLRRGARVRAPVCEVAVGAAWTVVGVACATGTIAVAWVPALLGLGWLGVAASVVDLRHRRLPDALTVPALPAALALVLPLGPLAVLRGCVGAVIAATAYGALHVLVPQAMGLGDVKLAASLGAVLGASSLGAVGLAGALAALLTGAVGVVGALRGRLRRGSAVPHGPSMLVAGWVVVLSGAIGGGAG